MPRRTSTPAGVALEKWADSGFPITWKLNPAPGSNVSGTRSFLEATRGAFASWSSVSTATVSFTEGSPATASAAALDGANVIAVSSASLPGGVASLTTLYSYPAVGNDPLGRPVLFPGQILEADIMLSPDAAFSTDVSAVAGRIHLESQLRHEIGHFLGLDHSGLSSAAMFPVLEPATVRLLSSDDEIGLSFLYPVPAFWTSRGMMRGIVRTASGSPVFGAHVVVVKTDGIPVASTVTGTDGEYQVVGLEPGNYQAYAEPLDRPLQPVDLQTFGTAFPNQTANQNFTTRFASSGALPNVALAKTAGDNQTGSSGQMLPNLLEVEVRDTSNAVKPGVIVTFTATSGGGVVVPIEAITDAQGKARTRAYLGQGQTQTFLAAAANASVDFSATLQSTGSAPTTQEFVWIGGASSGPTDWFVAANWSHGAVPDSTKSARISPTAKTQPVLTAPAAVRNLIVENGANLGTAGFVLTTTGNVDATGGITGTGQVRLTGHNVTAKGRFPNITLAGFVRAIGAISATGNLLVETGATFDIASIVVSVTGNVASAGAVVGQYGLGGVDADNGHVLMTGSNATVSGYLHTLRIAGTVHANGPVNLAGDLLLQSGTFSVNGQTVTVDGVFDSWFGFPSPAATLIMQHTADVLRIKHLKGDSSMGFTLAMSQAPGKLTAGLLEVADNFYIQGPFETSGSHKIRLTGQNALGQRIGTFDSFVVQDLEFVNTGLMTLTRLTVKGTLSLAGTGTVALDGMVTVNGTLSISGPGPVITAGTPVIRPGDVPAAGRFVVVGRLEAAEAATVTVDRIEMIGTLVRGFSGLAPRLMEFKGVGQSIPAGPGYKTVLWSSASSVSLPDGLKMDRFIFFPADGNATVSLAGNVNAVFGVFVHAGKLVFNGKTLTTFFITNECFAFYETLGFSFGSEMDQTCGGDKTRILGALVMQNAADVLRVHAFSLRRCSSDPQSTFSAGLLEVSGDFDVRSNCGSGVFPVFEASGAFKVRFNGTAKQRVTMSDYNGIFQDVEIANGTGVELQQTVIVKGTLTGSFSSDPALTVPALTINRPPNPTPGGVCIVFTGSSSCPSTGNTIQAKVTFASNTASADSISVTGRVGLTCTNCLLPSYTGALVQGTSIIAVPSGTTMSGQFGFGGGALDFVISVSSNVTSLTGIIRVTLQDFFGSGPVDIPINITVNKNGAANSNPVVAP